MNASQCFDAYFIWAFSIGLAVTALMPRSVLPKWIKDHVPVELGWMMLTGICLAAVGTVRGWAKHRQNKSLLWFLIPPVAVLVYEVWFLFKLFTLGIMRDWRELFVFACFFFTWYLWVRGNDYRERAKSAEFALSRQPSQCPRCGAQL